MDERKKKILQAVVESYIATAEPVGSRTIARMYELGISPATIRNEMQDLELMGYLLQPHTSAGRIPSPEGYRFYVDSLMHLTTVSKTDTDMIRDWILSHRGQTEIAFNEIVKVFASLTHNFSLAVSAQGAQNTFHYMRFLPFDDRHMVLVLVTKEGAVHNSIISIPEGVGSMELSLFAEKMNNALTEQPLQNITPDLIERLRRDILIDQSFYENVWSTIQENQVAEYQIVTDGVGEMIRQPEFQDIKKVKQLISLAEQSMQIARLLDMPMPAAIHVQIGEETGSDLLADYGIVQAQLSYRNQVIGRIAVIGPMRMEYARIVSLFHVLQEEINAIREKQ